MSRLVDTPTGYLDFEGNELTIGSKVDDPPKLRLTSPATVTGGGGGAISFNISRDGVQEEIVLVQGKQSERVRGNPTNYTGEITRHIRNGAIPDADAGMVKVEETFHDSQPGLATVGDVLVSSNGRFRLYMQGDGNLVNYDTSTTPWGVVWNSGTVVS